GGFAAAGGGGIAPPIVQLDGSIIGSGAGLNLTGDGNTVQGLSITRFPGAGLEVSGDNNTIRGNRLGVDPFGAVAGNGGGILIQGSGNLIGGATIGAGNVISGNEGNGILLAGPGANNNVIQGNLIGTDASGAILLPNEDNGIRVFDAPNNTIGGTVLGAGNVICGNGEDGIRIERPASINNLVQGNFIGTNPNEDLNLGNLRNGVLITSGAHDDTIGGLVPNAGNTIANNLLNGVRIDSGNRNGVLGNTFVNTELEPVSVAVGANANVQPPEVEVTYRDNSGGTILEGHFTGIPNTVYQVQVTQMAYTSAFSTTEKLYVLGTFSVTTDGLGNASYIQSLPGGPDPNGGALRTSLTCDNNTSEFGPVIPVSGINDVNLVLDASATDPVAKGSNVVVIINLDNLGPANTGAANTEVQIPPGGVFVSAANPGGTASASGQTVIFVNSLNKGQSANMTTTFRAPTVSGNYPINIRTFSTQNEGDSRDNINSLPLLVLTGSNPTDVGVRFASAPASVAVGQSHSIEMQVGNFGQNVATGVQLLGEAGADIIQILTSLGTPTILGRSFLIDLGTLLPGTVVPITLFVTSPDAGDPAS
ncbi:MAG TPA: hypothetical protein VIY86_11435, partial [Pirellulaceae bacterium]